MNRNLKRLAAPTRAAVFALLTAATSLDAAATDLPPEGGRWKALSEGAQVDSATFPSKSRSEAWIRYVSADDRLFTANIAFDCEGRRMLMTQAVIRDAAGKEETVKGRARLDLVPGTWWEEVFNALCKGSKQWWKVW